MTKDIKELLQIISIKNEYIATLKLKIKLLKEAAENVDTEDVVATIDGSKVRVHKLGSFKNGN